MNDIEQNKDDTPIVFTQMRSETPLSKEYWTGADGCIAKHAAAQMSRGKAQRTAMPFSQLQNILKNATKNHALCYGIHAIDRPDVVAVVDKGSLARVPDAIARTKEYFRYPEKPGLLMMDHDPSEYVERMTPDELLAALTAIHPSIAHAARIVRGSVSAGVHRPDESPRDDKGFHLYMPVQNAADIPRYGRVLFERLWLQGHGRIALSASGSMLERSPLDSAVFSPERLDFIAPPIIRAGANLVYTAPPTEYREGAVLDTTTLPDLDDAERAEYERLVAEAKAAMRGASDAKRRAWAESHIAERVERGIPEAKARADVERICSSEGNDLDADFVLHFASLGIVTVRNVLADPKRFAGQALADPVEGVEYGRTTAKFYWNDGKPVINSHAHGGATYFLHGDAVRESDKSDESRLLARPPQNVTEVVAEREAFESRADENPVLSALRGIGAYGRNFGEGKHDIICPFSGDPSVRAVYFEPTPKHPRGGYHCKCHKCHRKHRIGDLLGYLGIGKTEAMHRPTFRASGGELFTIVDRAEQELSASGLFFQQGGMIVKVITDERGLTKVAAVNKTALNYEFNGRFAWEKYDKRAKSWVPIDAPLQYAQTLCELMSYEHLPPLLSVARQPFFRDNNTLCTRSGYDAVSRVYAIFDESDYHFGDNASHADITAPKAAMLALLDEFEFATETDRAAALCALLTAAVRASLSKAPGILATAHSSGSGKSYLLDMAGLFASEHEPAAASFVVDDDEMRKQIIATLIESPAAIKFDEMKSDLLPIKTLLSCLSAEQVEGRLLGASKIVRPSTRTLMLFAGNNVQAVQDMCRRILTIHLDVQCETPATRDFSDDPLNRLKENRAIYVAHALHLIDWALTQDVVLTKRLNGFERWEMLCRRTVIALGLPDPCKNIFEQLDHDPDREQLAAVLDAVSKVYGVSPFKVRELVDRTPANSDLYELLSEASHSKGDAIDNRLLSRWFKRNAGKVASGKRFEEDTRVKRSVSSFRVVTIPGSALKPSDLTDLSDSFPCDDGRLSRINRLNRLIPEPTPKMAEGEI